MHKTIGGVEWNYSVPFGRSTGYEEVLSRLDCYDPKEYKKLPLEERIAKANELVKVIREVNVFPIYYLSDEAVMTEIMECMFETVHFYGDTLDVSSSVGSTLLDFMFPSLHLANAGGSAHNSMYDRFYDDKKLARCVLSYMSAYKFKSVRTMFFMYGRLHWQTAIGFSPMRAKAIYERFCKDGDVVYDPSAGYGGRLLGAMTSSKKLTYIGCEPNTLTYNSLCNLVARIKDTQKLFGVPAREFKLYKRCSETFTLLPDSVDFAFTCPPYFKLEKYCDEPTQSIVKFKKYDAWLEGYARPTLRNTYTCLKNGSSLCLVLANVRDSSNKKYMLLDDWKRIAEEEGFKFVDYYNIATKSRKAEEDRERILHFIKEE